MSICGASSYRFSSYYFDFSSKKTTPSINFCCCADGSTITSLIFFFIFGVVFGEGSLSFPYSSQSPPTQLGFGFGFFRTFLMEGGESMSMSNNPYGTEGGAARQNGMSLILILSLQFTIT
jgi:hypothetical protein